MCCTSGPEHSKSALQFFPGLQRFSVDVLSEKRSVDIKANREREKIASTFTEASRYFSSLDVKLEFQLDSFSMRDRITSIANKTNQFVFSFMRPTTSKSKNCCTVQKTRRHIFYD